MRNIILRAPLLVAGILAMVGFDRPGAHSIQVYLDDELVVERFITSRTEAATIRLDPAKNSSQLRIGYNECGRTVEGRKLTALDKNDRELKTWQFDGATSGYKDPMTCQVKEVLALIKSGSSEVKLRYASNDFPEGIHFLTIVRGGETKASLN